MPRIPEPDPFKQCRWCSKVMFPEEVQRETGRPGGFPEKEVLFAFMRDIASALDRTAIGRRQSEAGSQDRQRELRDMRIAVKSECPPYRRESNEQCAEKPSAALRKLSWFLARCGEASRDFSARTDATHFPLAGKVNGRLGMLRAFGNAIVPQVAAEFVAAFMECRFQGTRE